MGTAFKVAEAGSGSVQATISASTNTTTSYVASSAFTCTSSDVLEGLLLHCKRNNTTGTVTVGLSADNGSTYAKEVTVNASDMPANPSWVFFAFSSTLTADGGSDYKVGVKASDAANAAFYRDGTAGNWARMLRTDVVQAPTTGDAAYIVGQWTGAATGSSYTVTMDETATTDYGAINIGQNGTLEWGTSASTDYVLKVSGDIIAWSGGAYNMGTTGTPMPSTSTAELVMDCGSNVQYGIILKAGSVCQLQGGSKTYTWALLASDEIAGATEWTTNVSTGWADNDVIWIASTTRTYSQCEGGALNGAASGTTLTVDGFAGAGGGLANAHSGTSPCQAEIVNLTRNVKIHGASASLQTYIDIQASASIDADWAEFYWLGSATAAKYGITTTGAPTAFSFYGCALYNFVVAGSAGIRLGEDSPASSNIENCVMANVANSHILLGDSNFGTLTIQDCVFMYNTMADAANGNSIHIATAAIASLNPTISRVRVSGVRGSGVYFTGSHNQDSYTSLVDCVSHSNTYIGFRFVGCKYLSLSGCHSWRNNAKGGMFAGSGLYSKVLLSSCTFLGNGSGVYMEDGIWSDIRDCKFSPQTDYTSATGIVLSSSNSAGVDGAGEIRLYGCTFGEYLKHTTQSISQGSGSGPGAWFNGWKLYLNHCKSYDDTYTDSLANESVRAAYHHINYSQTPGDHRTYRMNCVNQTDQVIYKTAAPSERITPAVTIVKSESGQKLVTVASGATKTISVWARKSAAADDGGADYNGAQPRLILRRNDALGITSDTVIDTMTAAVGEWEQLTGTTSAASQDGVFEFFVDLDGTAGWVNVDDWSVS